MDKPRLEQIEEQAALFALGALGSEEASRFEKRLNSGCPLCQALVGDCHETLSALALASTDVAPSPGLRTRLLQSIGAAPPPKPAGGDIKIVRPNDTAWQNPFPGIEFRPLHGRRTMLVRMAPKATYPQHEHTAAEQCLVLEGDVQSNGVTAYAGDFTYMPAGSTHEPLYTENGCLLLIAYT